MKDVMILFDVDELKEDVDIISVPDEIYDQIEELAQRYLDWIPSEDEAEEWVIVNGKRVINKETDSFIKWLNRLYCKQTQKACIVIQHIKYRSGVKAVEF